MHIEIRARAGKELGNSSFIGGKIERKLNFFEIAEYVLKDVKFLLSHNFRLKKSGIFHCPQNLSD